MVPGCLTDFLSLICVCVLYFTTNKVEGIKKSVPQSRAPEPLQMNNQ